MDKETIILDPAVEINPQADYVVSNEYRISRGMFPMYSVDDALSFANLVKSIIDPATSGIFIRDKRTLEAIGDLSQGEFSPRCSLTYKMSDELYEWIAAGKNNWKQKIFIEFLEDHINDLDEPKLLNAVRQFHSVKSCTYVSEMSDNNNYRLVVEEKDAKGTIALPKEFVCYLPVLQNMNPISLRFKLSFEIKHGEKDSLTFSWRLPARQKIIDLEVEKELKFLFDELGNYKFFFGKMN